MILETIIRLVADGTVLLIVVIGTWALLSKIPNLQKYRAYCRVLMAGLTAYLLAKLVGSVYQPEIMRPFEQLGVDAGASFLNNPGFPSDHVLFATAITLAVWFETRYKPATYILVGLTVVLAVGRVLALVHTPLDVLGAVAIACVGGLWYLQRDEKPSTQTVNRHSHKKLV